MSIIRSGALLGVVIHHSAVQPGAENLTVLKQRASSYNKTHSTRSWAEKTKASGTYPYIAYHDMMARDGSILHTVDYNYVKYHASNFYANSHYIGICLDGNFDVEKPTAEMKENLAKYLAQRQREFKVDIIVRSHKQVADASAPTACAGKNIGTSDSGWLKEVIARTNEILKGNTAPTVPTESPEVTELKKQLNILQTENEKLKTDLGTARSELKTQTEINAENVAEMEQLQKDLDSVSIEKNRIENEKNQAVRELNLIKSGRFFWVIEFLEKLLPSKK